MYLAAMITVALVGFSGCNSSQGGLESVVAPGTTALAQAVDPIGIEFVNGPSPSAPTTVVATTFEPTSVAAPSPTQGPVAPLTVAPSAPPSVAPTAPVVAPALSPSVVAPAPSAAPTPTRPRVTTPRRPATTKAPAPMATPAPVAVPTPAPARSVPGPVAAPTTSPVPVTATPVTAAPVHTVAAVSAGASCGAPRKNQVRASTTGTATCAKVKGRWIWVDAAAANSTAATAVAAPAVVPGFDGHTITLGIIGTSTNANFANVSRSITAAIEARMAAINRRGGVAGKYPVRLVIRDANYDPTLTINEINATKNQVVGYASILGTPSVEAALPLLRGEQLLASPASQEARWALESSLLPVLNSYQVQTINGVSYWLEQQAGGAAASTVCAVSVASSFGDAGTEGTRFAVSESGAKLGVVVTLVPNDNNVAAALAQLRAAGCQAVTATVAPLQLVALVVGAARSGWATRWIASAAGFSDRIVTPQTGPAFEQTVWVVGDGPQWGDPTLKILVDELLASDNRYWTENPDVGLVFGHAQGATWEAVLERAVADRDLSRAGLLAASRKVATVNIDGVGSTIDYSQPVRLSSPRATIFAVDNSYRNSIRMLSFGYSSAVAARYKFSAR